MARLLKKIRIRRDNRKKRLLKNQFIYDYKITCEGGFEHAQQDSNEDFLNKTN